MLYVMQPARNPDPTAKPAGPGGGGGLAVQGLPLVKPPYGRITAIDMNNPDKLAFTIAHGDTPDNIKNHPALKGLTIPRTGRQGRIGVLTTKTLLIAGEGGFNTTPEGRGAYLRAYDKKTGADAGQIFMPATQTGSPMTYSVAGTQYLTVSVSGPGYGAELLVYKLGQ
jgi:quinoprotein glucose dehydrogenase